MAKHEFGIMPISPQRGDVFNKYEPQKYDCVTVDDKYIEPLLGRFSIIPCYWHSLDRPELGLAYSGITLIPPHSAGLFADISASENALCELTNLLMYAEKNNRYVIHFGI